MKIAIVSDIHLEFGHVNLISEPADVLVLAGDVIPAVNFDAAMPFFKKCAKEFEHVLYVLGNHCLDEKTECLTQRGWVNYTEIKKTDKILSLNTITGNSEWDYIEDIIIKPYNGNLLFMDTGVLSMAVTPNHRIIHKSRIRTKNKPEFLSNWKYTIASKLKNDFRIPVSAHTNIKDYPISDDMLTLLAWILTDGHLNKKCNGISIYQSKESDISSLLTKLKISYIKRTRQRNITHICGKKLIKPPLPENEYYIHALYGKEIRKLLPQGKTIPDWMITELSSRQINVFVLGIMAGDGAWHKEIKHKCGMVHGTKNFLDRLQILCVQGGISSKLSVARSKDYRLNINRNKVMTEIQIGNNGSFTLIPYIGDVWCLVVPHTNFMVRRKGKAFFTGNSFYGSSLPKTKQIVKSKLKNTNITLLDNSKIEINGITFLGSTLWTDCNKSDPLSLMTLSNGLNDFFVIKKEESEKSYEGARRQFKFTPEDSVIEFNKSFKWLNKSLKPNVPTVVITHHAPSYQSVEEKFKGDALNPAFASDLDNFILAHDNIKLWVHGHVHTPFDYTLGKTRVVANPRGYYGSETNELDFHTKIIEI